MAQQENKLFYQAQNLHHVISINEKYSLFGFNGSPLAERTTTQTLLLGIERQGTILSTIPGHALAYTPYGRRNVYSTTQPILGFNGELIQKIGDYYLLGRGYRSYNPTLMRFQSPDSQSPFKRGGINSYACCAGDSINFIDPSGHGKVKTISINPSTPVNRVTLEHNKQIKKTTGSINKQRNSLVTKPYNPDDHLDSDVQMIAREINAHKETVSKLLKYSDTEDRNALIDITNAGTVILAKARGFPPAGAIDTHGHSHYMQHIQSLIEFLEKAAEDQSPSSPADSNLSIRNPDSSSLP